MSNINNFIQSRIGWYLYNRKNHPFETLKVKIFNYFEEFVKFDNLGPVVSIKNNFDDILIPKNHVSRRYTDTYYVNEDNVLRTHLAAHLPDLLSKNRRFLVIGDCYGKEKKYPVYHQIQGVKLLEITKNAEFDLLHEINQFVQFLFPNHIARILPGYSHFSYPTFELTVIHNGNWHEIIKCGCINSKIIVDCCGRGLLPGWFFELNLDISAMILFNIPDIRLFWSLDSHFIDQFKNNEITNFQSFGSFVIHVKGIIFYTSEFFNHNDFCEIIRRNGGDLIKEIEEVERSEKNNRTSWSYRIYYNCLERNLTKEEIEILHNNICNNLKRELMLTFID